MSLPAHYYIIISILFFFGLFLVDFFCLQSSNLHIHTHMHAGTHMHTHVHTRLHTLSTHAHLYNHMHTHTVTHIHIQLP